jgi:type I restriction enzyme S subunit
MRSNIKVEISGAEGMANNITKSSINSFLFALPPLEEQASIAQAIEKKLSALDRLIHRSVSGIDLLQERRTALISAAVTGKIDVRDWQASAAQEVVGGQC